MEASGLESVATRVAEKVRETNASRAQYLGSAFALTFSVSMIGDVVSMGTLANHGFMFGQLFLSLVVVAAVRWTHAGRRHAGMVLATGIAIVSATGAAHLAQFGGLDGPYFYGSYVAPPIFIPILLSFSARTLATLGAVGGFALIYWFCRPDLFNHPMAHIPVFYLLTVSAISVGIGHHVHRLEQASFADMARLEAAAAGLEARVRAGEAAPAHLRREIARQLHDDVAQLITGARLQLEGWSRQRGRDDAGTRLAELLDALAQSARRMLEELRQPPERGTLVAELERLRVEYGAMGLAVDLLVDETGLPTHALGKAQVEALLASAREGLTNALRHGGASEATVSLRTEARIIMLDVMDNGRGRAESLREGYGLLGIRERVVALGGVAELGNYDEGLRLSITLPHMEDA
ncbi:MAG: histidine kinase [Myxococcota bacterium]